MACSNINSFMLSITCAAVIYGPCLHCCYCLGDRVSVGSIENTSSTRKRVSALSDETSYKSGRILQFGTLQETRGRVGRVSEDSHSNIYLVDYCRNEALYSL